MNAIGYAILAFILGLIIFSFILGMSGKSKLTTDDIKAVKFFATLLAIATLLIMWR